MAKTLDEFTKNLNTLQQELNPYIACKSYDLGQSREEISSLKDKNDNLELEVSPAISLIKQYCRTCLIETDSFIDVNSSSYLLGLFNMVLSNVNLGLTKNPVVCQKCFKKLEECGSFLTECNQVEMKLQNFCILNENLEAVSIDDYFRHINEELVKLEDQKSEDLQSFTYEEHEVDDIDVKSEDESDIELHKRQKTRRKRTKQLIEKQKRSRKKMNRANDLANTSVKCETCDQKFTSKWALDRHLPVHNKKNTQYFCSTCDLKFKYKYSYEKHLLAHNLGGPINKPFGCSCGKSFNRRAKLLKHQEIHVKKDRPFGCHSCGKRFLDEQGLNGHIERVHVSEKAFSCELCGNKYTSKAGLDVHVKTHFRDENPKPVPDLMCDICGKLFFRKYGLEKHHMSHTGDKPHKCDECGMSFKERYQLTIHMRRHTGEKPFGCDVCGFKFPSKNSLAVHTRIHTGIRPFPCQFCDMAFTRNDHLVKHIRAIHTGERPFECDICKKTFNRKDYLLKHKKVHVAREVKIKVELGEILEKQEIRVSMNAT
ncbi:zinc finger protein OZF-like [Anthonomus grandis grandis]|uniref:zinc finger protein OZF-like n=1 Tax=Anthonomus grandis grandis TaxID=2921223 RepID=UPI0021659D6B|nr:zinc finger protein OZF-like [Anthonomus grandis grandis]